MSMDLMDLGNIYGPKNYLEECLALATYFEFLVFSLTTIRDNFGIMSIAIKKCMETISGYHPPGSYFA